MAERGVFRKHMSTAGEMAKKGDLQSNVGSEPVQPLPVIPDNAQFLQGNFAGVVGGAKAGGSQHPGAPDGGSGGGSVPEPLLGHSQQNFAGTSASSGPGPVLRGSGGNPKRGSGNPTKVQDLSPAQKD